MPSEDSHQSVRAIDVQTLAPDGTILPYSLPHILLIDQIVDAAGIGGNAVDCRRKPGNH